VKKGLINAGGDDGKKRPYPPREEATSDETVSDLEEAKNGISSGASKDNEVLSPDGAFDEGGEIKDVGPDVKKDDGVHSSSSEYKF
jgi:hypothetical protein